MAEPVKRNVSTAFPPPPPLWKHFTPENMKRLEELRDALGDKLEASHGKKKKWSPAELRALDLPAELRYLVPPELPTEDYSVFGELQSLSANLPSLRDQGIDQVYHSPSAPNDDHEPAPRHPEPLNHAYYLLKISKSLLLNFLEFVGILSISPEQFETKLDDMRSLFINAHHILNLYRPHQARESLILLMEEQLSRTREEIKQMDKTKAEIDTFLEQLQSEEVALDAPSGQNGYGQLKQDERTEHSRLIWDLLSDS